MHYARAACSMTTDPENMTVTFSGPCIITEKIISVTVPVEGLARYADGELIQNAFPTLSRDDREFLMSGVSKEGWEQIFGNDQKHTLEDLEAEEI